MSKFKPCPFCGCSVPPAVQGNGIGDNWLECTECGASTRLREDGAGSEKDWNSRAARATAEQSNLTVWSGSMPESNGKTNFTAILHRGDLSKGHTIDRSEYPDRVRYEADRVRWLIGEIDKEPWILDYDADKHSGYVSPNRALKSQQDAAIESKQAGQSADAKDAARYRWLRDETVQDSLERPFGIAISILAPHRNEAGNFDIDGWAVTYEEDADAAIDAAIESQRSGDGS
jgi:hypothetical protein